MIKPTGSYKMRKTQKFLLCRYKDPHVRGAIKRSMIQADLEALIKPKNDKNRNRDEE